MRHIFRTVCSDGPGRLLAQGDFNHMGVIGDCSRQSLKVGELIHYSPQGFETSERPVADEDGTHPGRTRKR
jgi:hypothetical protein